MDNKVWLTGRYRGSYEHWQIIGIFNKKNDAINACETKDDFYTKIELDHNFGDEVKYMDCEYPITEGENNG